jgi:hypothetical protein
VCTRSTLTHPRSCLRSQSLSARFSFCLWPSTFRCALLSALKHLSTASTSYPAWKRSFPYSLSASASATRNPSSNCYFSSFLADGDDPTSMSYQELSYSTDGRRPTPIARARKFPYPGLLPSLSATPLPSTGIHPHTHTQIRTDILALSPLSLVPFPIQMEIYGNIILAGRVSLFAEMRVVAWSLYLEDGVRVNILLKSNNNQIHSTA